MVEEPPETRYFRVEARDGVTVVHFDDIQIGPDARDQLYALVDRDGHKRLLLDLGEVWALTSYALGILANLQKKATLAGGRLRLCCVNPNLMQLFRLTKFDQIFEIGKDQEEALRGL